MNATQSQIKELRDRWDDSQSKAVIAMLQSNLIDEKIGFGRTVEGLLDCRGIRSLTFFSGLNIVGIDLSYSVLNGIGGTNLSTITDLKLCGVDFSENVLAVNAKNCDFSEAKIRVLSGSFANCNFRNAGLSKALGSKLHFEKCNFANANMWHAHLFQSTFSFCNWDGCKLGKGSFANSEFHGIWPKQEEFGDTILEDVGFLP